MGDDTPNVPRTDQQAGATNELADTWAEIKTRYMPHILSIVLGVLIAGGVTVFMNTRTATKERELVEASRMFMNARSIRDMDALVTKYPSSPYTPLASLRIAKGMFDEGSYASAQERYADFVKRYPDHPTRSAAEMGVAMCLEARGRYEEARIAFAKIKSGHYLEPQAVLGQGRCLSETGKASEAKALYEDYLVAHPESAWAPRFKRAIEVVDRKMKAPPPAVSSGPRKSSVMPSVVPGSAMEGGIRPILEMPSPRR